MPVCEQDFEDGVLKQTRIHLLGARGIEGIITVPATGSPTLNWLFYDGHGNMVRTMNTTFALSTYQWRGVWGERTTSNAGRGYCANLGHPEDETGLVYMRARYYEPGTGRFISEDPARDGVNWYLYVSANPTNKIDIDGRMELNPYLETFIIGVIAGFFAGVGGYLGAGYELPIWEIFKGAVAASAAGTISAYILEVMYGSNALVSTVSKEFGTISGLCKVAYVSFVGSFATVVLFYAGLRAGQMLLEIFMMEHVDNSGNP